MRNTLKRLLRPRAAIREQNAMIDRLIAERDGAREERDKLADAFNDARSLNNKHVDQCDAKDIEIVRLTRELDGARRACDKLQNQADVLEQGNAKFTATMEALEAERDKAAEDLAGIKHTLDQCEADRNAIAHERDEARAKADELRQELIAATEFIEVMDDPKPQVDRLEIDDGMRTEMRLAAALEALEALQGVTAEFAAWHKTLGDIIPKLKAEPAPADHQAHPLAAYDD